MENLHEWTLDSSFIKWFLEIFSIFSFSFKQEFSWWPRWELLEAPPKVCYGITRPSRDRSDTSDYYNVQIIVPSMSRNLASKVPEAAQDNHIVFIWMYFTFLCRQGISVVGIVTSKGRRGMRSISGEGLLLTRCLLSLEFRKLGWL